jgi:hypothetical protein
MFKPKTFDDFCRAMQTGATVNVDGIVGVIFRISVGDFLGRWDIAIKQPDEEDLTRMTISVS